ncbi:MAG: hypothetical protein KAI26_09405, partial [Nanoarchaeota archaeon]|nr:hypothetical protein [Nanoarchaeota archaeon]
MKTLKERYYVMMVVILVIIGLVYLATLQHYASEKTQTQLEIQNLQNQAIQLSNEKETLGKQLDDKQSMLMIKEEELRNKSQEIDKTIAYFDSYFKAYNYFSTATSSSASGDYYYGLASTEYDYDSYQYV